MACGLAKDQWHFVPGTSVSENPGGGIEADDGLRRGDVPVGDATLERLVPPVDYRLRVPVTAQPQ